MITTINLKLTHVAGALLATFVLTGCPDNNNVNEGEEDSGNSCSPGEEDCICNQGVCLLGLECVNEVCTMPMMECQPGDLGCECIAGECLNGLECTNNLCIDPNCTLGEGYCGCLPGDICVGDFECVGGLCICAEQSYHHCADNDVYWYDSCGVKGALKDDCTENQNCLNIDDDTATCESMGPGCGDGMVEMQSGEECDGNNFNGATCESLGYGGGDLSCTNCTIDTSQCETCGNGLVDPREECDGTDLDGQTCQSQGYGPGMQLGCTSSCELDTSGCSDCGNGVVDLGEECDGLALDNASCMSEGYPLGGPLGCTNSCTYDDSQCIDCECEIGQCCDGCSYEDPNVVCEADADTQYGCPSGTDPGDDVSIQTRDRYCSGTSSSCTGSYGMWSNWSVHDVCGLEERCSPGDSSCNPCNYSFNMTSYQCQNFSASNGGGNGGGELMIVCATTDAQGYMTVKARKFDGTTFGNRPYQVRVSDPADDPCGPNTPHFVIADSDPVNIGTTELSFSFQSNWLVGQTQKAYCVTASTQQGDLGYNPNNPQQQSWWWSDKAVLQRTCN